MIECKPKGSTYFSLSLVVIILFSGLVYLVFDFAQQQTYGFIFYLFSATLLTIVLLILLVKMMAGFRFISAGNKSLHVRLPLRGLRKKYTLQDVLAWEEETIVTNKKEFRQTTIVFGDQTSFSLSNHEHTNYPQLLTYLKKKIPGKKLK